MNITRNYLRSLTIHPFFSLLLCLLGLFLVLGQLLRIQISTSVTLYPHDFVISIYVLVTFLLVTFHPSLRAFVRSQLKKNTTLLVLFSVLCLYTLAQAIFLTSLTQVLYLLRWILYLAFAWSVSLTVYAPSALRKGLLVTISYAAVLGLLQRSVLPDTRFLASLGWDDHYYRLIGTFFDPNFTGLFLATGVVLAWKFLSSWVRLLLLSMLTLAVALTYSRASYLALGIMVGVLSWTSITTKAKKERITSVLARVSVILVVGVSAVLFIPKPGGEGVNLTRTSTIVARQETAQTLLQERTQQPLLLLIGRGLFAPESAGDTNPEAEMHEKLVPVDHATVQDNVFLLMLDAIGLLGMLALLPLVPRLWSVLKKDQVLLAVCAGLTVHAQFNNSVFEPFLFVTWCLLWATYQPTAEK